MSEKVSIIGAGSFGTSIAQIISNNCSELNIFGRNEEVINSINKKNINHIYHPLINLNNNIKARNIANESHILQDSDLVFFCIPSGSVRLISRKLSPNLQDSIIISTAKGIDYPSFDLMTQVISQETGNNSVFSLSGPTFADELIRGILSAFTLGIDDYAFEKQITKLMNSNNLIFDFSSDIEGVELCGVLKNVYALAMGVFDTYFQGDNEHYALLNSCFKEMNRILIDLGHNDLSDKFCAFGDFNLTSSSDKSRNRTLGLMLGKNMSLDRKKSSVTIESIKSVNAIKIMVSENNINAPIIEFVISVLNNPNNVRELINKLISLLK